MILRRAERSPRTLTILCYHRILPLSQKENYYDPDLVVTPESFAHHCAVLARHYNVRPLRDALQLLPNAQRPLAAITFDDGYHDNFLYAAPILAQHQLRATFFIIAGLVDTDDRPWYDIAGAALSARGEPATKAAIERAKSMLPSEREAWVAELRSSLLVTDEVGRIMSSDEVRRLHAAGHEIGSHSLTHPLLPQCSQAGLEQELVESKRRLETIVEDSVTGFCYPNGSYDDNIAITAAKTYSYASTMDAGMNTPETSRFELRRWFIHEARLRGISGNQSSTILRAEISGLSQRFLRRGGAGRA